MIIIINNNNNNSNNNHEKKNINCDAIISNTTTDIRNKRIDDNTDKFQNKFQRHSLD